MRQIKVKLGRTYNMGNYESLRVEVELASDIDDAQDYQQACKDLFVEARKALKTEASKLVKAIRG